MAYGTSPWYKYKNDLWRRSLVLKDDIAKRYNWKPYDMNILHNKWFREKHLVKPYEVMSLRFRDLWEFGHNVVRSDDPRRSTLLIQEEGKEIEDSFIGGEVLSDGLVKIIKASRDIPCVLITGTKADPSVTYYPKSRPCATFTDFPENGGGVVHLCSTGGVDIPTNEPDPVLAAHSPLMNGIELSSHDIHKKKMLFEYVYSYAFGTPFAPHIGPFTYLKEFSTLGVHTILEDQICSLRAITWGLMDFEDELKLSNNDDDSRNNLAQKWREHKGHYDLVYHICKYLLSILGTRDVNLEWETPFSYVLLKGQFYEEVGKAVSIFSAHPSVLFGLEKICPLLPLNQVTYEFAISGNWKIGVEQCDKIIRKKFPIETEYWTDNAIFNHRGESQSPQSSKTPSIEGTPPRDPTPEYDEHSSDDPYQDQDMEETEPDDQERIPRPPSPDWEFPPDPEPQSAQPKQKVVNQPVLGDVTIPVRSFGRGHSKNPFAVQPTQWGGRRILRGGGYIESSRFGETELPPARRHPQTLTQFMEMDYSRRFRHFIPPTLCALCLEPIVDRNLELHFEEKQNTK